MHQFPPYLSHFSSGDRVLTHDYELYSQDRPVYPDPPTFNLPLAGIPRQLGVDEVSIKTPCAPSSAPWAVDVAHLHSLGLPGAPAGSEISFSGDLSSASGADSPRSPPPPPHTAYMHIPSYPSPPYSYEDTMLHPSGYWSSPSPSIVDLNTQAVVPPQVVQPYLEAKPLFETGQVPAAQPSTPSSSSPASREAPSTQPPRRRKSAPAGARKRPQKQTRTKSKVGRPAVVKTKPAPTRKKKSTQDRNFVCSFRRYGCTSTFSSKNEWKRHVTSKHIQLGYYTCDVDRCKHEQLGPGKPNVGDKSRVRNCFNRKDLFTQHQRRMHAPWVKKQRKRPSSDKEQAAFENSLEDVRARCWREQRKAPSQSACGFCGQQFAGPRSWEDRMEHVGRHFENSDLPIEVEREDEGLREWALSEGIVRPEPGTGNLKLTAPYQ